MRRDLLAVDEAAGQVLCGNVLEVFGAFNDCSFALSNYIATDLEDLGDIPCSDIPLDNCVEESNVGVCLKDILVSGDKGTYRVFIDLFGE